MKRFSAREFGLLMAPVLVIGAAGWWVAMRPQRVFDEGKPRLTFGIEKPTTLEAFDGVQADFLIGLKHGGEQYLSWPSAYLEVQTSRGPKRFYWGLDKKSQNIWRGASSDGTLYSANVSRLPRGALSFGCKTMIDSSPYPSQIPLYGKWKIDRAQIKALNLAALPRKPLISLRQVEITRVDDGPEFQNSGDSMAGGRRVFGEAIFGSESEWKSLEKRFSSSNANIGSDEPPISKNLRHFTIGWTIYSVKTSSSVVRISGRVSADNRWPLGFEIEPFDFKSAKVGQKLRFKQGPVALPKS